MAEFLLLICGILGVDGLSRIKQNTRLELSF